MPNTYTSKKTGVTKTYPRNYPATSGTQPNLTLLLRNPTLTAELRDVAKRLDLLQDRGAQAGQGSLSQLVEALGQAARRDGVEAVANRLKFLIELVRT